MAKLRLLGICYWIKKSPAYPEPGLCIPVWFNILQRLAKIKDIEHFLTKDYTVSPKIAGTGSQNKDTMQYLLTSTSIQICVCWYNLIHRIWSMYIYHTTKLGWLSFFKVSPQYNKFTQRQRSVYFKIKHLKNGNFKLDQKFYHTLSMLDKASFLS